VYQLNDVSYNRLLLSALLDGAYMYLLPTSVRPSVFCYPSDVVSKMQPFVTHQVLSIECDRQTEDHMHSTSLLLTTSVVWQESRPGGGPTFYHSNDNLGQLWSTSNF